MFEELDQYLKEFATEEFAVDYWYDEGFLIAEDMLQEFQNDDWEALIEALPKKTIGWKHRLAYCLNDSEDCRQLEVLLTFLDTDDAELFEIAVDALRSFKNNEVMMGNHAQIVKKIEAAMPEAGAAAKRIFREFLEGTKWKHS